MADVVYDDRQAEGRRARKRRETERSIRDAGLALFLEQGYHWTSVGDIATRADVSVRTFYRYFPSKEDLLLADARRYFAEVERIIGGRPADEAPMRSFFALSDVLESEWTLGAELLWLDRLISENPAVRGHFLMMLHDHEDRLTEIFARRLHVTGSDPSPRLFAGAGVTAYLGSIREFVARDGKGSSWAYGRDLLTRLCRGIDPGAVPDDPATTSGRDGKAQQSPMGDL